MGLLLSTLSLHHGLEDGMRLESTWIRSVSFAVVGVVLLVLFRCGKLLLT